MSDLPTQRSRGIKMKLPKPECEFGYTESQVTKILGSKAPRFWNWMNGQTFGFCDGRIYDHEKKTYEKCCNGESHGTVVYPSDLERFLNEL
jgi:hypothetical protein